nr:MAG TPA: hypothetical protein [Caudoviricetes sp.]
MVYAPWTPFLMDKTRVNRHGPSPAVRGGIMGGRR